MIDTKNNRLLICPYSQFSYLNDKYKKTREVTPDRYCPDDAFYYWNGKGQMRHVDINKNEIYESMLDGSGYPTGFMKRIR